MKRDDVSSRPEFLQVRLRRSGRRKFKKVKNTEPQMVIIQDDMEDTVSKQLCILSPEGSRPHSSPSKNTAKRSQRKQRHIDSKTVESTSADDFETPVPKRRKVSFIVKEKQKGKATNPQASKLLRTRTTPKPLHKVFRSLTPTQKQVLIDIGFGCLIDMDIEEIPGLLGHFVLDKVNTEEMELQIEAGGIKITADVVHDILGIPKGPIDISSLPSQSHSDPLCVEWRQQYETKHVRPSQIVKQILKSNDAGILFILNFCILFASTMVCIDGSGACLMSLLHRLHADLDFKQLNWCSYLIEALKSSKASWTENTFFTGPITFLQLLYLDGTRFDKVPVERKRPAISSWNTGLIKKREALEIQSGGFGLLPLCKPLSTGQFNDRSVCEEDRSPVEIDELCNKIEAVFSKIENDKRMLGNMLKDGRVRFPGNDRLSL